MHMPSDGSAIIIYGTTWCPDCRRSKQFLAENRIQYAWVDIEQDPVAMAEVERLNEGRRVVPTIVFTDGVVLTEPSNEELAAKLGLITTAKHSFYDLIIIGGGPAGLTAAIYSAREGLHTLILEKGTAGGQIGDTQMLDNFPGFDEGIPGMELARRLIAQAQRFGVEILQSSGVDQINRDGRYLCIHTADGNEYGAQAVLIATGSRYRRLNVPGEKELVGSAIHFCAVCDGPFYKDKDVLVVGGGNSGFQEGLFLSRYAKNVTIVEFLARGEGQQAAAKQSRRAGRHARGHQSCHPGLPGQPRQAGRGRGARSRDERGADLASRWRLHLRRPQPQQRLRSAIGRARSLGLHRHRKQSGDHDAGRLRGRRCARRQHQASGRGRRRGRDRRVDDPRVFARTVIDLGGARD